MIFRSKLDQWVPLVLLGTSVLMLAAVVPPFLSPAPDGARSSAVLAFMLWVAAMLVIYPAPRYRLQDGLLEIRSGVLLRWRIPVANIVQVRTSTGPLSARRLRISYRPERGGRLRQAFASPRNADAFLEALRDADPLLLRYADALSREAEPADAAAA